MAQLLSLFDEDTKADLKKNRVGSFVDNMKLPVHRWFRYSAGFSANWVKELLLNLKPANVFDPFAGSGTVNIVCDEIGIPSFGYEAHPFVYRIADAKTYWDTDIHNFRKVCNDFVNIDSNINFDERLLNNILLVKCYEHNVLKRLLQFKSRWIELSKHIDPKISSLLFLCLTAILRSTSFAGTAQWQYILPEKRKKKIISPDDAIRSQAATMINDMWHMQSITNNSLTTIYNSDSRDFTNFARESIGMVITSPPYANNYDYADATRLEMTFWGEVSGWGDLHTKVRKHLICSSSQHASKEKYRLEDRLHSKRLDPIHDEISEVCDTLGRVRLTKGGKKNYHTMIASYFADMADIIYGLHDIMCKNSKMFVVIGDSAPYGVYVPVERWLGEIALGAGFKTWNFDKIRDRNVKWKNRKHDVPLKEGVLLIEN